MARALLLSLALMLLPSLSRAQDGGADAGLELDAGSSDDAGPASDAGALADGGDAGTPDDEDAGTPDGDAGTPGDDAGTPPDPMDGGTMPPDCQLRCDGNVLRYCDAVTGEPLSIDCDALEARCGILSSAWGLDCLLPEGAPCASGYADGLSRCDPAGPTGPLFCNMNTCQTTAGGDVIPEVPDDSGGLGDTVEENPHPLACLGCSNDNNPLPFSFFSLFVLLGLRQLTPEARRRRRNPRTTR
jgi:hypothetical protein